MGSYINEIVLGLVVLFMAVMWFFQARGMEKVNKDLLNRLTAALDKDALKDYVQGEMRLNEKLNKKQVLDEIEVPDPKIFKELADQLKEEEGVDVG